MKPIIGLAPTARLFQGNDPFQDQYIFVNNYAKRILENGGMPMGLTGIDGCVPAEALETCQGFLLCGGGKLWPYHLQVVEHAVQTGKPLLGICLGMQAICAYFRVREAARQRGGGDTLALFAALKEEGYMFNLPVAHHWDVPITYTNIPDTKHPVDLTPGSYLRTLVGQARIEGASLHHYQVNGVAADLTVAGRSADGAIEAVEKAPAILGVQFHPEVDETLGCLFRDLVEKSCRSGA